MSCWWLFCVPLLALGLNMAVQLAMHFLSPAAPIVRSYAGGCAAGAICSLGLSWGGEWADVLTALLTFGGLSYAYSNFINVNYSSLRLRILKEMVRDGDETTLAGLQARYGSEAILDRRLTRLVEWGQLRKLSGRFHAERGGFYRLGLAFRLLKKLLLGRGFRYENTPL